MTGEPSGVPSDFSARSIVCIPTDTIEKKGREWEGRSS